AVGIVAFDEDVPVAGAEEAVVVQVEVDADEGCDALARFLDAVGVVVEEDEAADGAFGKAEGGGLGGAAIGAGGDGAGGAGAVYASVMTREHGVGELGVVGQVFHAPLPFALGCNPIFLGADTGEDTGLTGFPLTAAVQ